MVESKLLRMERGMEGLSSKTSDQRYSHRWIDPVMEKGVVSRATAISGCELASKWEES